MWLRVVDDSTLNITSIQCMLFPFILWQSDVDVVQYLVTNDNVLIMHCYGYSYPYERRDNNDHMRMLVPPC